MQIIKKIEFFSNSKEENLPQYEKSFPHIYTEAHIHEYSQRYVPWHWHAAVELFYMEKGELEYTTSGERILFTEGSVGIVNSNILHTTKPTSNVCEVIQKLQLFDISLIDGPVGSRISQKYITPVITCPNFEIIALYPKTQKEIEIIELVKKSFALDKERFGHELFLRNWLSEIWLRMFELIDFSNLEDKGKSSGRESLKTMMIYIHEHYGEKVSAKDIAGAGFLSERECYRIFHEGLHCTPVEYLNEYRIQTACSMLMNSTKSITEISNTCGFSSSSYFCRSFQRSMGCSPSEFRTKRMLKKI